MKLQVALDFFDIETAIRLIAELRDVADIIEVGTPFIIKEGIRAVAEVKRAYPDAVVLADLKIMDAGEHEARIAFDAGADIITVLGAAEDATIVAAVAEARKYDRQVMVDMISVPDIRKRAMEIDQFGVDYICVHTAFDVQGDGRNPLKELQEIVESGVGAKLAVAGGINADTLSRILPQAPEIVIVGGSITSRKDRRAAALELKELMK